MEGKSEKKCRHSGRQ